MPIDDEGLRNTTLAERREHEVAMGNPSRNMTDAEREAHAQRMGLPDTMRNVAPSVLPKPK